MVLPLMTCFMIAPLTHIPSSLWLITGWKHQTVNLGETIGVGGQEAYGSHQRLVDGYVVIKGSSGWNSGWWLANC